MKKDRQNVTYEYRKLNTKELVVDEMYQRDIDPKRVARIAKNYDPCLVNAAKISFRDGKFFIFDGRHTSVVEKTVRGKGKDVMIDCKVYSGLTRLDEMELFVAQNGESSPVRINDKLKALYNFGDPDVLGMVGAAQLAGVRVDFSKGQAMNKVTAVSTLMKIYLRAPRNQYIDMLSVMRLAWAGIPDGFAREIMIGMEKFYQTYYGQFNSKDLIKSLSKIAPVQIVREGKSIGAATFTSSVYARIILRIYNNGRTTKRLEDKL